MLVKFSQDISLLNQNLSHNFIVTVYDLRAKPYFLTATVPVHYKIASIVIGDQFDKRGIEPVDSL